MKLKRKILLFLVLTLILTPATFLSVSAANKEPDNQGAPTMILLGSPNSTVDYTRQKPEVAILNMYNGNSAEFYSTLMDASSSYNGIRLFGKTVDSQLYADDVFSPDEYAEHGWDDPLYYHGFENPDTTLYKLNAVVDQFNRPIHNLEVGVSGTFHNNWHMHATKFHMDFEESVNVQLPEEVHIMSYSGLILEMDNKTIIQQYGSKKDYVTNPRVGDLEFASLKQFSGKEKELILWITRSGQYFDSYKQYCTCGGHYVDKTVVAFRDQSAPQISEVWLDGDNIYGVKNKVYKSGDPIEIKIVYNEPIRFADDSAEDKGDLYVKLVVDGVLEGQGGNIHPKAYLTKLDNNTLYFSYTVPDSLNSSYKISQIDLSPLMGTEIELKHVGPVAQYKSFTDPIFNNTYQVIDSWLDDGTFAIKVPSDVGGKALGFNETTSYITDLAGNPINNEIIKSDFSIDTQEIEIIEISPSFFIAEPNIKEMLGKTNPADPGYADNSDTHMGGMAMFKVNATFNKLLAINNKNGIPVNEKYDGLVATTNMKDEEDKQITLASDMAFSIPSKNTEMSSGYVTQISFHSSHFVNAYDYKATCEDEDGILRITSITYATGADQLKDIVGNKFAEVTSIAPSLMNKTLYLDADKAIATTSLNKNEDNLYSPEPVTVGVGEETRAFRFPFAVEDSVGNVKSGVNDLTGTFAWAKIGASSSQNWPYQYLITNKTQLDGTEEWSNGFTGNHYYDFVQLEGVSQYVYIRPVVDHDYSLFDTELRFKPLDYAGNEYRWNEFVSFPLDITWEDEAPTASAKDVRRSLGEGNTGTIEVDVLVQDQSALHEAYYHWSDEKTTPPASDEPNWIQTNIVFDSTDQPKTGKITATATVPANSEFSKYLWVRVLDTSGNELITNLGLYEYNLKEVAYGLKYSTGITSAASLQLEKMEEGGLLVFMVPVPGTPNEYFVRVFGANVADRETPLDRDAFRSYALSYQQGSEEVLDTFWRRMTVTESSGKYTFEYIKDANTDYIESITRATENSQPYFSGNLQVIVLSGKEDAFVLKRYDSEKYDYPLNAGTETHHVAKETVSLRVSHNKESADTDTFQNIIFEPLQTIDVKQGPKSNEHHWIQGDPLMLSTAEGVKFSVDLGEDNYGWNYEDVDFANSYIELQLINTTTTHRAYLKTGKIQTVVFPNADYEQGDYKITLYVNCFAGKGYKIDLKDSEDQDIVMHIDTSPAAKNFGISALKYTPAKIQYKNIYYSHGLDTQSFFNWETDSYSSDQVIYLPAHLPDKAHELTVEVKGYKDISEFAISVWNVTANGQKAGTYYYNFDDVSQHRSLDFEVFDTYEEAQNHNGLGLVKNEENIIAVQIQNRNGIDSQIKYYNIYPVDVEVKGATSVTRGTDGGHVVASGNIIFTPDEGQLMDGVRVFATAIPSPISSDTWKGTPQEMAPQFDGTYTSPLIEDINHYFVYSIDKYGNLNLYDIEEYYLDPPLALVEEAAPVVTVLSSSVNTDSGAYEAVFKIEDDTINAYSYVNWSLPTVYMPLTVSLSFDAEYEKTLKIQDIADLEFTLNENEDEFVWKSSGRSPTGIYEVRAIRKSDVSDASSVDPHYLEVTVLGAVHYQENDPGQTFTLYLDATDASGNSTLDEIDKTGAEFANVISAKPRAYTSEDGWDKEPVYAHVGEGEVNVSHMALIIKFNMPVLPESSWINPEPQYGTVQVRAFPITKDGTYEIKFHDVFGNSFVQELTIDNVIDPGLTVEITPSDLTAGDVVVRVIDEPSYFSGGLILYKKDGESLIPVSDDESIITEITSEKQITLTENTALVAYRYVGYVPYEEMVQNNTVTVGYKTEITIDNIVKSAPTAQAYLYFTETGIEYAADDEALPKATSGKIIVHYKATTKVVPTNSTGTEHTFKYSESDTYTFSFEDGLGQTGSLTVDLSVLGVTMLEPTLTSPVVKDEEAPRLTLDMYAMRSNSYIQTDTIAGTATSETIKGIFDGAGYVQGYLFEVSVLDQSSYKIVLKNTEPQGEISYATAVNDSILGASLVGRMITLTPDLDQDLYIVVVDNAIAETGAENDNYAYVLIKASDLRPWFDTLAPTIKTETVTNSLYEKTVYIKFSDKANDGHEIDYVNLISPKLEKVSGETGALEKYNGWYKLVFNDNGSQELVFSDLAGNRTDQTIEMSGIDDSKPVVKVVWSPPHVVTSGDVSTIYETSPTLGPVNTDIKAIITADKPMASVFPKEITYDGTSWDEWPYFSTPEGISFTPDLLYTNDPVTQLVTVTFSGESNGVLGVRMEITAPNWQTSEVELQISEGAIDKTAPEIETEINYQKRGDYSTPYAAEIILTPNEPAYCLNAGKAGVLYDENNPLKVTTILNSTATYRFADKAGNIGNIAVTTKDIDRTPPKITTDPANTKNLPSSTAATIKIKVDEACTITVDTTTPTTFSLSADTEHTITFTENGVYQIKATDNAGNSGLVTVVIGSIDKTAPMISFDNLTVRIRQDSQLSDLEALLDQGVNVWDNLDAPEKLVVTYDLTDKNGVDIVNLSQPGLYEVLYIVEDTASNQGYATRYVRVFDKGQPVIIIGGQITEPEGTIILTKGQHQLIVEGLKKISASEMEPYTIKITQGIRSEGQMKYYNSTVPVDAQDKITLNQTGFYTLYITTQSRQSYRTLLYVEK